jgi:hypothetical protein
MQPTPAAAQGGSKPASHPTDHTASTRAAHDGAHKAGNHSPAAAAARAALAGTPAAAAQISEIIIHVGEIKPALVRAARLFLETMLIPSALLFLMLNTLGLVAGLSSVLGWCALTVSIRWIRGRHLPGTLLVCAGVLCARATIALVLSSALVYLLQPVVGSIFMALLFVGSALFGRPITMRLARDFVSLPNHILQHRGLRRMFTQVAILWGVGRIIDAAMSLACLRFGVDFGLLSRGLFSGLLTALMVLSCAAWGAWCIRRLKGVSLRFGAAPAAG